jgi:anti-anti-sigma factor
VTSFGFDHDVESGACVARVCGDIDIAVVPELRDDLQAALEAGCTNVVIDLAEVVYADSSALGLLVWLDHRLRPIGGRLVLAAPNRDITRVLELSGLVHVAASVSMSANVESALEGLHLSRQPAEPLWTDSIEVPARPDELAPVRETVADMLQPLGFADSAVFDIKVALGEALANAVRHGAPCNGEGVVRIDVTAYDDRVVIDVSDNGTGFEGYDAGSEDVYAPSGRGIMFMRALMDRVEFETSQMGGTLVRLVKHRRLGQPSS